MEHFIKASTSYCDVLLKSKLVDMQQIRNHPTGGTLIHMVLVLLLQRENKKKVKNRSAVSLLYSSRSSPLIRRTVPRSRRSNRGCIKHQEAHEEHQ